MGLKRKEENKLSRKNNCMCKISVCEKLLFKIFDKNGLSLQNEMLDIN